MQKLLYFLIPSLQTTATNVLTRYVTAVQNLDARVNVKNNNSLGDRTVIWCL